RLSAKGIFKKLHLAARAHRNWEINEIANFLLKDPRGLGVDFTEVNHDMFRFMCEVATWTSRIDLLTFFETFLPVDRFFRYELMLIAAIHGSYDVIRFYLHSGNYPSKLLEQRDEQFDTLYAKEVLEYGRIAYYAGHPTDGFRDGVPVLNLRPITSLEEKANRIRNVAIL
ncbi:MAG: hypothetical protein Harvfovirus18_1, partial [Harvfovirus sp.]